MCRELFAIHVLALGDRAHNPEPGVLLLLGAGLIVIAAVVMWSATYGFATDM
jgi:hypothetical protein